MRFKTNVEIKSFQPDMLRGLFHFEEIRRQVLGGIDAALPMVITSMNDSAHMVGSLHYQDKAADIRSKDLDADRKHQLLALAKAELDMDYDIILEHEGRENEHYHMEYDPR